MPGLFHRRPPSPSRLPPRPARHSLIFATALALMLASPATVQAQTGAALPQRIAELGEQSRFVPEQSLRQLRRLEDEARAAVPAVRAEYLLQLAIANRYAGKPEVGLALAEELIDYGRAQRDDTVQAKGLLAKAYVITAMGQGKAAQELAFEAHRLAGRGNDRALLVQTTIVSGQAWAERGHYPAALVELQNAVELARPLENALPLVTALNALTVLYRQMKEYDKGFEVLEETLATATRLRSPGRLALAKSAEYGLAIDAGQNQRALKALGSAIAIERRIGAHAMVGRALVNMSDAQLKLHDYPAALEFARQAIAATKASGDKQAQAASQLNHGQALIGMGRVVEGKRSFENGLRFYEAAGDKPELQPVLLEYGSALEKAGDYPGAIAAYHRERAISNELFEIQRQKSIYELQEKYEADKKKRQIELLSRENQIQTAEIDNRRLQQRIWWLLMTVFALAAAVVGLLYRKVRQTNAQLEVKNQELKQQSARDPLTGLYNRRHFQEFMRGAGPALTEIRGPRGLDVVPGAPDEIVGALFLLDVDHFKHVNDRHGHAAGDAVLKAIATTLHEVLRETDMIVRWGGEEFLAFLPAVARGGIEDIARRVLDGVAAQTVPHQGRDIAVKVSIGFAPFPLVPGDTPLPWERAVNLVDMALYLAKGHGRNRAYGVRGFAHFERTTMEAIEQDLERAWREGLVELGIVLGGDGGQPGPAAETSNVLPLKRPAPSKNSN